MATEAITISQTTEEETFEAARVAPIVGAHFVNDTYTAFVSPLLPVIIEKLSLSLTAAGSLTAILQLPAVINPLIGYMADRISLRYFVIFTPAITATLISSMGFAQSYAALAILFFITGISVAAFHAPAPAMIARVSGKKVGLGMSLFMAGGELARTIGPLIAVWAVSLWSLEGFYRLVIPGWATTAILYWGLHSVPANPAKQAGLASLKPALRTVFLPILFITFFRNFMVDGLVTYLPTYMKMQGSSLLLAGGALSILEFAGVGGALLSGTISDRLGRKITLLAATAASTVMLLLFLRSNGWLVVPILLLLGFTALSATPVMLAIVQDQVPEHRAMGNGLYMTITFLVRPVALLTIGYLGDHLGLQTAYFWSALISLLVIPAILALPGSLRRKPQ
jgi:FSR family fosmidomycin resistance protein-like MFS transporter